MFAIRHSQQKVTPQMVMRISPNSSLIKYALGIGAATALCGVAFSGAAVAEGERNGFSSRITMSANLPMLIILAAKPLPVRWSLYLKMMIMPKPALS
jgi:hypothetical protein